MFIGPNVTFTNDPFPKSRNLDWVKVNTIIKTNAKVGANLTILAGIEIGEFSMVGAGNLLAKSKIPFSLW